MAVRQYIGARYVPRFVGTFDPTQQYEALDVVDNGSGTSYIARKIVPPGTPLTDTGYWFLYGASSGAIVQLQNDVSQLQSIKEDPISERTFLMLGDSYDTVTADHWSDIVAGYIKCADHIRCSIGGANFIRPDAPYSTRTYINNITNQLTQTDLDKVTDVVIGASINDNGTMVEIENAMQATDIFLRANIPHLKNIYLIAIGWDNHSGTAQDRITGNLRTYSQYAPQLGWKFCDCTRVMRLGAYTDNTDGCHPLQTAVNHISECMAEFILSGCCTWSSEQLQIPFTYVLPTQWAGATVTRPTNLESFLRVRALSNGTIVYCIDNDILLNSITGPLSYDVYNIIMTFDDINTCPIPFYYYQQLSGSLAGTSNVDAIPAYLERTSGGQVRIRSIAKCTDNAYSVRILTYGTYTFDLQ